MTTCHPITKPVRSAVPTFEPVTLDQAKAQCDLALGIGDHNEPIAALIQAAREQVERDAMLVCCTGSFTWKMTDFGYGEYFELPSTLRPVSAISSIVYTANDGTSTTFTASQYALDTAAIRPLVRLTYGNIWPTVRGDINGITVTAVAGYASQLLVPANVKQAVLARIAYLWRASTDEAQRYLTCYENLIRDLRPEVYA